jgi:hypothetical protein
MDAEVAGSGLGLGEGKSSGAEKSAERYGREPEYSKSHHKVFSIERRRQYKA